jgi:hypothetical protein
MVIDSSFIRPSTKTYQRAVHKSTDGQITIRRRFEKSPSQIPKYIKHPQSLTQSHRDSYSLSGKMKRQKQVVMHRNYRIGDLPDIQIKSKDILAPLSALVNTDSTSARILFAQLFKAVIQSLPKVSNHQSEDCAYE